MDDRYNTLLEIGDGGLSLLVVDADVDGLLETEPGEVVDLLGLGGAEEDALAVFGQQGEDLGHLLLEADFENAVGLVDDQVHQVVEDEPLSVLHVVQKPSRSAHQDVYPFLQLQSLHFAVRPSDQ